jgi:hypothetical protein
MSIREEIIMQIRRYENCVRGLDGSIAEEPDERDKEQLMARRWTYVQEMIPTLKRLLELCPANKTATIIMKFPGDDEEYPFGTFDFNTPLERRYVNEQAMQIRNDRFCETEVRVNE